jgi:hypothetical protein
MHSPPSVSVHSASEGEGDGWDKRSDPPPLSVRVGPESEPQAATVIERRKIADTGSLKSICRVYLLSVKATELGRDRM